MIVSTLTGGLSGWRSTFRVRKGIGAVVSAELWWHRTCSISLGDTAYEVTVREPSKTHFTTRMVTSSLKASPQKTASALEILTIKASADSRETPSTTAV